MIRTGKWKIGFYNIGYAPEDENLFGCATLGAVLPDRVIAPDEPGVFLWKDDVQGTVIHGSYEEVLLNAKECGKMPSLCLVFLAAGRGAETLINGLKYAFPGSRIAGGVAANCGGKGELSPSSRDAAVLLLDDSYLCFADNILRDTGKTLTVGVGAVPRRIDTLDGEDALPLWRTLQAENGIPESDFECMTLSDADDVNVHMNGNGNTLNTGADCVDGARYKLRLSTREEIDEGAACFCNRANSLIVGCAGLKSAMSCLPTTQKDSLVLFLFGEIAKDRFANLMMTGIVYSGSDIRYSHST